MSTWTSAGYPAPKLTLWVAFLLRKDRQGAFSVIPGLVRACAMTTKFLDNKICTFKILLWWRFPRKTAFWTIFLSAAKASPPQKARILFLLSSRRLWVRGGVRHPPELSEVSIRGWRTEGFGTRRSFLCQRCRPLFCTLFLCSTQEKADTILGELFGALYHPGRNYYKKFPETIVFVIFLRSFSS